MKSLEAMNRIRDLSWCNEGGLLWPLKLDHPISISWGNLREWGGRGGVGCQSGIGGVKSKPVLLEFLVAVNVKKCTILGVKRVVPLVYRGGGGCNSYTRIWGHFGPFLGVESKPQYMTQKQHSNINNSNLLCKSSWFSFRCFICYFCSRPMLFSEEGYDFYSFIFIYNTSIFIQWFPQFQKTHFFIAR